MTDEGTTPEAGVIEYYPVADDVGLDLASRRRRYVHVEHDGREISFRTEPPDHKTITVWNDGKFEVTMIYKITLIADGARIIL